MLQVSTAPATEEIKALAMYLNSSRLRFWILTRRVSSVSITRDSYVVCGLKKIILNVRASRAYAAARLSDRSVGEGGQAVERVRHRRIYADASRVCGMKMSRIVLIAARNKPG